MVLSFAISTFLRLWMMRVRTIDSKSFQSLSRVLCHYMWRDSMRMTWHDTFGRITQQLASSEIVSHVFFCDRGWATLCVRNIDNVNTLPTILKESPASITIKSRATSPLLHNQHGLIIPTSSLISTIWILWDFGHMRQKQKVATFPKRSRNTPLPKGTSVPYTLVYQHAVCTAWR